MKTVLQIAKAMSDPNRLRVLCVLREQELCACDIIGLLGLAQATVSRHMNVLVEAGLVLARKEGRWTHYRLPESAKKSSVQDALIWVHTHAGHSASARQDRKQLQTTCTAKSCCP